MVKPILGIIGGGQLGSMLVSAAKKINVKTVIFSNDKEAPAQNFSDEFIYGKYDDIIKINEFIEKVDLVTFEFENIPYNTLNIINKNKKVLPSPKTNKIIQNRLFEKNFINELNIKTTKYISIKNKLPSILPQLQDNYLTLNFRQSPYENSLIDSGEILFTLKF